MLVLLGFLSCPALGATLLAALQGESFMGGGGGDQKRIIDFENPVKRPSKNQQNKGRLMPPKKTKYLSFNVKHFITKDLLVKV